MKNIILIVVVLLTGLTSFSQSKFKEQKAGHIFYVSLPEYMSRTTGLNSAATIQFKNSVKDIAGFIIEDNKEELKLAEMNYSSINEFYDDFIKDFLADEQKRTILKPQSKKIGEINFIETDASYYDTEAKSEVYYFVGIAETSTTYYKFICFGNLEDKAKFKDDFQKTFYSIRE